MLRLLHRHRDVALALVLSTLLAIDVLGSAGSLAEPIGVGWIVDAVIALVLTVSLAWRRRAPILVLAVALAGLLVSGHGVEQQRDAWVIALLFAVYSVGAEVSGPLALLGAAGVVALTAVAVVREPGGVAAAGDSAFLVLILGGPWVAGSAIRLGRRRERALERRTEVLAQGQETAAQEAVAAERARIARELHDVVAHALSVIILQARGARRTLVGENDAREAFDTIEATGTQALTEMRRLLGVLRTDDQGLALSPQPSLRDLGALVDQVREAGLPVAVSIEGTPIELPPGVDLAAYRILQEALTNCLRHARSATASVLVRYGADDIDLEVTDTGQGGEIRSGGHGLIGMRERVVLYGGSIEIGPQQSGGFAVRAHLPLRG